MSYDFRFGSNWLSDFYGVTIKRPPREVAKYDGKREEIPGRSRDEYIDNGRYKNVTMIREIGFSSRASANLTNLVEDVINWLAYNHGYQEFEDDDHPNLGTFAILENFSEVQTKLRKIHKATLEFSRDPFWYASPVVIKRTYAEIHEGVELINPYPEKGYPRIIAKLSDIPDRSDVDFDITLNGVTVTFEETSRPANDNSSIIIDCEKQIAYKRNDDTGVKTMLDVEIGKDFCCTAGTTVIRATRRTSTLESVSIQPKWRCL